MPWAEGANLRKEETQGINQRGRGIALLQGEVRLFLGEGPACGLTLELWHGLGDPPGCWEGTWLLICHLLKVAGKDMASGVSGMAGKDKNTIPSLSLSCPCIPWHRWFPPAAVASSPQTSWQGWQCVGY